jgi:transposase
VSSFKYGFVTTTVLTEERTRVPLPNNNKSLPIGTIAAVKEYLTKLGFDGFFNGLKERGIPLFPLVCALISYRLTENFSVEGCGRWLSSKEVRKELNIRCEVSSRMLNRAVERVGENMEDALIFLRDSLFSMYELEHTDVNADSTSISVYSKQTDLFRFGYSRDKRPDLRQVNVCVTELREPINIPIHMTVESGNNTDPAVFLRSVSDIIDELRDNSLFVLDAGGDSKNVSDLIQSKGKRYIVRKKMNISDDVWISKFDKDMAVCVSESEGIYCNARTFTSSGRTVYLFFSEKLYRDKMDMLDSRAQMCVHDANDVVRRKRDGTLRISRTVIKRLRNPLISLNVSVQAKLLTSDEESFQYVRDALSNGREGFFKLECSEKLTPSDVLRIYRKRDSVEKLIDSLKNQIDLKPLRVWSENSVKGVLFLAFLAQVIVSMMRYEVPELRKRSTKFIISSLQNLTVTYVYDPKGATRRIYSNFEPINSSILRGVAIKCIVSGG